MALILPSSGRRPGALADDPILLGRTSGSPGWKLGTGWVPDVPRPAAGYALIVERISRFSTLPSGLRGSASTTTSLRGSL